MNGYALAAGIICLIGAIGHPWYGEARFLKPYKLSGVVAEADAQVTYKILRLNWHVWGIAYAGFAMLLAYATFEPNLTVLRTVATTFGAAFVASIPIMKQFHPAQVMFGLITILCVLAYASS